MSRVLYVTVRVMGFVGAPEGMTSRQRQGARYWLRHFAPKFTVHGMSVGGDDQFDAMCEGLKVLRRGRPRTGTSAFCKPEQILPPEERLDVNCKIVGDADAVVVCPHIESHQTVNDNAWFVWDICRIDRKLVVMILPDGTAHCSRDPYTGDVNGVELALAASGVYYTLRGQRMLVPLMDVDDPRKKGKKR